MIDPSDDPKNAQANGCNVHDSVSFPIDEECPRCLEDEENECCSPYQEYIKEQDRIIKKLKERVKELGFQ